MIASVPVPAPLDAACDAWSELLGADRVAREPALLDRAARTTLPSAPRPSALLRPSRRDQVAAIVRIAARHRVPLYPISAGKNWGWGDACPSGAGQVVLDLSALDRIVTVDEELGCAVIEPGVTQGALARHLAATGSAWRLDCAGAGPRASLMGNALERGLTFGAFGERFGAVCGLEVVLPDGTVTRTGFGDYGAPRVARAHRLGVGPVLDGLFSQSALGVVTELGLWLTPVPPREETFAMTVADEDLAAIIDRLRPLRMRGVLHTNVHLFLLPPVGGRAFWGVSGGLAGAHEAVAAHMREVEAAVAGVARCAFLPPDRPPGPDVCAALGVAQLPGAELLIYATDRLVRGEPFELPPPFLLMIGGGPEVQRPTAPPTTSDPLDADMGLIFSWQGCAAVGSEVRRLVDLTRAQLAAHGCPPLLAIQLATPRAATLVTRVGFDRKDPARRAAARACQRALLDEALAAGFPPVRMGLDAIDRLDPAGSPYWALVRRLKQSLDPDAIIAPGHYEPSPRRPPERP
jgi:4-cresol dehydrogenase (hydroxylating)